MLVIAGTNGTGKTHVAKAVSRWIGHVGRGKEFIVSNRLCRLECVFWRWPELLDAFKAGSWDIMEDLFHAPVLILDDLGAEHDPSGVGIDKLCQVLSRRERMWTLITTNITPDNWRTRFDKRVASRMYRNSTLVDLSGVPDYCV